MHRSLHSVHTEDEETGIHATPDAFSDATHHTEADDRDVIYGEGYSKTKSCVLRSFQRDDQRRKEELLGVSMLKSKGAGVGPMHKFTMQADYIQTGVVGGELQRYAIVLGSWVDVRRPLHRSVLLTLCGVCRTMVYHRDCTGDRRYAAGVLIVPDNLDPFAAADSYMVLPMQDRAGTRAMRGEDYSVFDTKHFVMVPHAEPESISAFDIAYTCVCEKRAMLGQARNVHMVKDTPIDEARNQSVAHRAHEQRRLRAQEQLEMEDFGG